MSPAFDETTLGADLTYNDCDRLATVADERVDLSRCSDETLAALDERLNTLLADVSAFPSDEAFQAAIDLSAAVRDEQEARDPRRDDPYFAAFDTTDRYDLPIIAVEVSLRYRRDPEGERRLTFTFDERHIDTEAAESTWSTATYYDISDVIADYFGVTDLATDAPALLGESLPVVGYDEGGWGRVDRYALEHGTPALPVDDAM